MGYKSLNLKKVDYKIAIQSSFALVELNQIYQNPEDSAVDLQYSFPVNNELVFYDFQAEFEGKLIKGEILSQQSADKFYQEHASKGDTVG